MYSLIAFIVALLRLYDVYIMVATVHVHQFCICKFLHIHCMSTQKYACTHKPHTKSCILYIHILYLHASTYKYSYLVWDSWEALEFLMGFHKLQSAIDKQWHVQFSLKNNEKYIMYSLIVSTYWTIHCINSDLKKIFRIFISWDNCQQYKS